MRTSLLRPLQLSLLGLALGAGCSSPRGGLPKGIEDLSRDADSASGQEWHRGPDVHVGDTGPARFVGALNGAFQVERALEIVRYVDGGYRAPANPCYDAVLERLAEELRAAGFGQDTRLELEFIEEDGDGPAWTPKSARLELVTPGGTRLLHAFDHPADADRVLLPINAPACDVEGRIALHLEELEEGMIFVTDVRLSQVLERAQSRGAAAVVSASLQSFNTDPSGAERHLDAIQFRNLRTPPGLPVAQISPRAYRAIEQACLRDGRTARLRFLAEVETESRPLRTLVATIVGEGRPDEAVAMSSHVQEPGACDNATGVAGLLESALALVQLLQQGTLPWPDRSLVFLWGDEFRQTSGWLDQTDRTAVAGISSDMTGQSKDTGAIALLERMPDPGALVPLPPDEHTPWGAGEVTAADFQPNGLAVIARCAMIDVGLQEEGGWPCADHPWEGGSDHDVFIERGIPAVLFWHFTDFTYHTSLDRMGFVDGEEMRRTAVALLSTALAVAHPQPADLDRYLRSLAIEEDVRVAAAEADGDPDLADLWRQWCLGARQWLRNQCLAIDESLPEVER